jgi:hypothetical protein
MRFRIASLALPFALAASQAHAQVWDPDLFSKLPGVWEFTANDGRTGQIVFPAQLMNGAQSVPLTLSFGGSGSSFSWGFRTANQYRNWMNVWLNRGFAPSPESNTLTLVFTKDASGKWSFTGHFDPSKGLSLTYGAKKN